MTRLESTGSTWICLTRLGNSRSTSQKFPTEMGCQSELVRPKLRSEGTSPLTLPARSSMGILLVVG